MRGRCTTRCSPSPRCRRGCGPPGGRALNHDPRVLLRTQDLEPVYEENSCLYLFDADTLLRTGNRIGERPLLFPIDPHEALDIDDEYDWDIVAAMVARKAVTR